MSADLDSNVSRFYNGETPKSQKYYMSQFESFMELFDQNVRKWNWLNCTDSIERVTVN